MTLPCYLRRSPQLPPCSMVHELTTYDVAGGSVSYFTA